MPKRTKTAKPSYRPVSPDVVDEIASPSCGEGCAEVPGFAVRKNELYELMKHWYRTLRGVQFDYFLIQTAGARESWLRNNAYARIATIADVLGREVARRGMDEVDEEFLAKEPYFWQAFVRNLPVGRGDDGWVLPETEQPPLPAPKRAKKNTSRAA